MNEMIPRDTADTLATVEQSTMVAPSLIGQLVKAEIDQQIATAHQYPRNLTRVRNNITSLATMTQESAEECGYALPRGNKPIVGPSIRLAEIVMQQFGNCRTAARVVHVDRFEKYVEAEGVFHDLETNSATTARVRRRIVDKNGRLFNDDMIIVTGNAACSIAKRNAILAGVPKALWGAAYDAAMQVVKGDVKTMTERIAAMTKVYGAMGVTMEQVCEYLEIDGLDALTIDHVATMGVVARAIRNQEATVEDYFRKPADGKEIAGKAKPAASLDAIAAEGEARQAEASVRASDAQPAAGAGQPDAGGAGPAPTQQTGTKDNDAAATGQSDEDLVAAYQKGREAARQGRTVQAVPPAYKAAPALKAEWQRGWIDEDADANDAG